MAFTTALQNEMAPDSGGGDGNKPEGERQMDTGGDQMETESGEKEEAQKDDKQVDDDDTMNVE